MNRVSGACCGQYEDRLVTHAMRCRGSVIVIDHVPAEVCRVCGDVLLRADTIRWIEMLLHAQPEPAASVPLYEFSAA